jgi:hypothetical protein
MFRKRVLIRDRIDLIRLDQNFVSKLRNISRLCYLGIRPTRSRVSTILAQWVSFKVILFD